MLALTSFAYTNIGELSGLIVRATESFRSNRGGMDEIEDPGPSLMILEALDLRPEVEILDPSPLEARTCCGGVSRFSMTDLGLGLLGVAFKAPLGVDDALSTLAFLDPDRGVMLELKKALTGVATSSANCPLSRPNPSSRPSLRRVEVPSITGDATILADTLPLPTDLGECVVVFARGRRVRMAVCLSEFITAGPYRIHVEVAE